MRLSDYISQPGNSATKLAADCGVAVSTITRAAKGEWVPSATLMKSIVQHTGGTVTPNDFFGLAA